MAKINSLHSDYWSAGVFDVDGDSTDLVKLIKLSNIQRSVSNYVHLLTGDNTIRVEFCTNAESSTDGNIVRIGASLKRKLFDSTVGVALHEASHIKFSPLNEWNYLFNDRDGYVKKEFSPIIQSKMIGIKGCAVKTDPVVGVIFKTILNILEDRRIDQLVYGQAPGYRPYYTAMYKQYYRSSAPEYILTSDNLQIVSPENYIICLINLPNESLDVNVLPGLKEMIDLIDWKTLHIRFPSLPIRKMHNAFAVVRDPIWKLADTITSMILAQCPDWNPHDSNDLTMHEFVKNNYGEEAANDFQTEYNSTHGEYSKKEINSSVNYKIQDLSNSEASIEYVKVNEIFARVPVVLIKNVTIEMIKSNVFPFAISRSTVQDLEAGIRLGNILANKLQIRSDPYYIHYINEKQGDINRRALFQIALDKDTIFKKTYIDSHKPVVIHISIDASSSMNGIKWDNALTFATALAFAADKIPNLDVVISLRGTANSNSALIAIVHDSRKNSFAKSRYIIERLAPYGATPEGLCFDAMRHLILDDSISNLDCYFINLSDGRPEFNIDGKGVYSGDVAYGHCRSVMNIFRYSGIKILSYFITDGYTTGEDRIGFNIMYGTDGKYIDVTNLSSILKTLTPFLSTRPEDQY